MKQTFDPCLFYNNHDNYRKLRQRNSIFRKQYLDEIDQFKIKYLSKLIPSAIQFKTILEVGCATGDLVGRFPIDIPLSNRYGIDISSFNIEFAKDEYPEVNFCVGTFTEFLENEGKNIEIDIVILSDILEHVENDIELLKMTGDYGKYILVNIPMEKCWETRKRNYGKCDISGHLRAYNLKDVQDLIAIAGLNIIDFTIKYYCKETLYKSHLKDLLFKDVSNIRLLTRRIPKYIILLSRDSVIYKWYKSCNFFALLKA